MGIRVFCADLDPVVSIGMRAILKRQNRALLVGGTCDLEEVFEVASEDRFDVLVAHPNVKQCSNKKDNFLIAEFRRRYPNKGIVLHLENRNPAYVTSLCAHGCYSVVDRRDVRGYIEAGIIAAFHGARYVSPSLSTLHRSCLAARGRPLQLSVSELETLRLLLSGFSVSEIANCRCRAKQTISTHKASAMTKLGFSKDAELFQSWTKDDVELIISLTMPSAVDSQDTVRALLG